MAEKSNKNPPNVWGKPVPMKLFAAWEVDRTPPNCIPRLCTLNLTRLVLLKPVVGEMNSVIIAVKMQSSKRILRSNEIQVLNNGLLDTEIDLTFSLQYPHFLKRSGCGGNHLQIMLQRRKRYKNRAILGFKTLAGGVINMAEVLQRPMDRELELSSNGKEQKSEVIAKVAMYAMSSQPVDQEEADRLKTLQGGRERAAVDNFSDEEEEYTSNEDGCDSEAAVAEDVTAARRKSLINSKLLRPADPAERNIKQKIIALLKKFRVPEVSDSEQYQEELLMERDLISQNPREFEDLMDELESMSDSDVGPDDIDDISISSTPKPSLRPFFSSGTLTALEPSAMMPAMSGDDSSRKDLDNNHESGTDQEFTTDTSQTASPPKSLTIDDRREKKSRLFARGDKNSSKDKRSSSGGTSSKEKMCEKSSSKDSECSPQKTVLEQLAKIFPSDDSIPDHVIIINAIDVVGNFLAMQLLDREENVITILSNSDLRASFSCLMNKIQKFCNCNSRAPQTIKIGILGQDSFFSSVLRLYAEHFSTKPFEWQSYIKFCIVPLSPSSSVAKSLGCLDSTYGSVFMDGSWKELIEHCSGTATEMQLAVDRILHYICNASALWQMAIAEAMVTYKEKSSDDESSQVFIPFITDVKIGMMDGGMPATSLDEEAPTSSAAANLTIPANSPPCATAAEKGARESTTTPPSSPSISSAFLSSNVSSSTSSSETMDLQLDYWILPQKGADSGGKKGESSNKLTMKTTFRTLHISRIVSGGGSAVEASLTLGYITKEKQKQKIMRLGKKKEKEKELDNRFQQVEGIQRLICSCRTLQTPLKVTIDGVEWGGVKFFQLTSQWQTHVKYFPVALYSMLEHPFQSFI